MLYKKSQQVQSPLELRFLEDCVTVGLIVEPQFKIGPIHADFAIPERNIAIEIDSTQFHSTAESRAEDRKRDNIYNTHGWDVVRIPGGAVMRHGEDIAYEIKTTNFIAPVTHIFKPTNGEDEYNNS